MLRLLSMAGNKSHLCMDKVANRVAELVGTHLACHEVDYTKSWSISSDI